MMYCQSYPPPPPPLDDPLDAIAVAEATAVISAVALAPHPDVAPFWPWCTGLLGVKLGPSPKRLGWIEFGPSSA